MGVVEWLLVSSLVYCGRVGRVCFKRAANACRYYRAYSVVIVSTPLLETNAARVELRGLVRHERPHSPGSKWGKNERPPQRSRPCSSRGSLTSNSGTGLSQPFHCAVARLLPATMAPADMPTSSGEEEGEVEEEEEEEDAPKASFSAASQPSRRR